jgi:hypothetical protein
MAFSLICFGVFPERTRLTNGLFRQGCHIPDHPPDPRCSQDNLREKCACFAWQRETLEVLIAKSDLVALSPRTPPVLLLDWLPISNQSARGCLRRGFRGRLHFLRNTSPVGRSSAAPSRITEAHPCDRRIRATSKISALAVLLPDSGRSKRPGKVARPGPSLSNPTFIRER